MYVSLVFFWVMVKKFYVIFCGNRFVVYESWEDCYEQVNGVPNACFRGFYRLDETLEAHSSYYGSPGVPLSEDVDVKFHNCNNNNYCAIFIVGVCVGVLVLVILAHFM